MSHFNNTNVHPSFAMTYWQFPPHHGMDSRSTYDHYHIFNYTPIQKFYDVPN